MCVCVQTTVTMRVRGNVRITHTHTLTYAYRVSKREYVKLRCICVRWLKPCGPLTIIHIITHKIIYKACMIILKGSTHLLGDVCLGIRRRADRVLMIIRTCSSRTRPNASQSASQSHYKYLCGPIRAPNSSTILISRAHALRQTADPKNVCHHTHTNTQTTQHSRLRFAHTNDGTARARRVRSCLRQNKNIITHNLCYDVVNVVFLFGVRGLRFFVTYAKLYCVGLYI